MASEDSDQVSTRLPVIHRLRDLRDLDETARGPMLAGGHNRHAALEALEVFALRGPQWMLVEEWNDRLKKIAPPSNLELHEVLAVIVVTLIYMDASDPKERLKFS